MAFNPPEKHLIDSADGVNLYRFLNNKVTFYVSAIDNVHYSAVRISISDKRFPTIEEIHHVRNTFWQDDDSVCIFLHPRRNGPNNFKQSVYVYNFKDQEWAFPEEWTR